MKILILGAGQVGSTVAENLVSENNDITVVDLDAKLLKQLQDRLDIRTVAGNAAHPSVLQRAGAEDTDLMLALTRNDETNLVASKFASDLFNVPTCIARMRSSDYVEFGGDDDALARFGVDQSICPEQLVTHQLSQLFDYPGALRVLDFADGRVQLVVVRAVDGGQLVGKALKHIRDDLPDDVDCRVCAIYRKEQLVIPDGDTVVLDADEVFFLAPRRHVALVLREMRKSEQPVRRVMIAGGGNIGYRLARALETRFAVKIIESRPERCQWLAEQVSGALVLQGEATNEELLEDENVDEMDMFCALTNDDEDNIMSCLLAKKLGAKRVVALVNRGSYVDLLEGDRIDVVVSPHLTTISEILAYIRHGDVVEVHSLRRGAAEAMEIVVHGDRKTSKVVGRRLEQIAMPAGCHISAIVRGETVQMAHHDLVVEDGDHLIIFVAKKRLIREVEKLIQPSFGFF
ncbi:Trk system potassium transporter TrkA [Crenobacter luteus]|uniref:Trk system potassium uptake protein TrkA n=1 Tax=Crenobacter luteus TaxID=1452487 RepID=A0A165G513_9NEIS|nr:Trk system potassium transporter TrkA [Crenobacter luteus]KZE35124.1 potassium transporter peripheral membrane component [Crenobacter luteus]